MLVACSLFLVPCCLFLVHCSLFLVPCSLFLVPCSLFLVPCSLLLDHTSESCRMCHRTGFVEFHPSTIVNWTWRPGLRSPGRPRYRQDACTLLRTGPTR